MAGVDEAGAGVGEDGGVQGGALGREDGRGAPDVGHPETASQVADVGRDAAGATSAFRARFHCLSTAFPGPSTDFPLPCLARTLPFHCLTVAPHCLSLALPLHFFAKTDGFACGDVVLQKERDAATCLGWDRGSWDAGDDWRPPTTEIAWCLCPVSMSTPPPAAVVTSPITYTADRAVATALVSFLVISSSMS